MFALYALLAPLALADTLTLDSGATIEGALVSYDPAGECRVEVAAGELAGTTLLVSCARLRSFERDPRDFEPVVSAVVEEEAVEEVDLTQAESLDMVLPAELAPLEPLAAELEPLAEELEPLPALVPALPPAPPVGVPARVPSPERAPTVRAPVNSMTW